MAEEFETVEIEYSEDDVLYYLFDENDNEIGIVIEEDGKEVEYYYEWVNREDYEGFEASSSEAAAEDEIGGSDESEAESEDDEAAELADLADLAEFDGEVVEMEVDEDAIDHYLFDADGNEIGFVIMEDGVEVECYYQDEDDEGEEPESKNLLDSIGVDSDVVDNIATKSTPTDAGTAAEPAEPVEHGYLYKLAQIAGHEGNKARKRAGDKLGQARNKAKPVVDQARTKAEAGIDKATEVVETGGQKLKQKQDEYDLGITREGVAEATADLNAIAKEGAETAKELKEAYDDIMDSFGFLMPKGIRRKLP